MERNNSDPRTEPILIIPINTDSPDQTISVGAENAERKLLQELIKRIDIRNEENVGVTELRENDIIAGLASDDEGIRALIDRSKRLSELSPAAIYRVMRNLGIAVDPKNN